MEYGQCMHCGKPVNEDYVANQLDEHFCNDDCYENYYEQHEETLGYCDEDHPYHFHYSCIRGDYLYWRDHWKSNLKEQMKETTSSAPYYLLDLLTELEQITGGYEDYWRLEGADGVFSREIYRYLLKWQELIAHVRLWRPERTRYFGLRTYGSQKEQDLLDAAVIQMAEQGWSLFDDSSVQHHPLFDLNFDWIFDYEQDRDEAYNRLRELTADPTISLDRYDAYICDLGCGDFRDIKEYLREDGWFDCDSYGHERGIYEQVAGEEEE